MQNKNNELLANCFSQAILDVFSTMAGQYPIKAEHSPVPGGITGVMMLLGENNALLSLNLSRENTAVMVSYMTGSLVEELAPEDLYDGIAELVNMIAGRAKALLAGTGYHYKLTPPLTIVGEDHFVVYKKKAPQLILDFVADGIPLHFELTYL